jgi:acetyl-CoA acetyltransferase
MTSWSAMWARRYMHEFKVTKADLAEVAVFTRYHATLNPDSVMGSRGEVTVDDVLASRFVCEPLYLLDAGTAENTTGSPTRCSATWSAWQSRTCASGCR